MTDIDEAIAKRVHAEGMIWMVIEATDSIPLINRDLSFKTDEDGEMVYGPNEKGWKPLLSEDIPEWVAQPSAIADMKEGNHISSRPGDGGRWYRGRVHIPEGESVH